MTILVGEDGDVGEFEKEISGALKATINAHGPITQQDVPSATKRIAHALREAMKRERDHIMTTQPRQPRDASGGIRH